MPALKASESGISPANSLRHWFVQRHPAREAAASARLAFGAFSSLSRKSIDKNRDEFKRVFFSAHPDVAAVVRYKNFIFVEAIRDLEREANFRPYEAESRVFIIDDADSMNDAASNALLKTLEEPPATSHLILVTARADSLLPTIRSRCQMVRFAPVEPEVIADLLAEKRGFSHTDVVLAARLSGGSVARALSTDLAAFRESRERMFDVLRRAALDHDLASMIEASNGMNETKNKEDLEGHLRILETLVRDAWLLSLGADGDRIVNSDLRAELEPVARASRPAVFASWLAAVEKLREGFEVNINRRVATDALLVAAASQ